MSMLQTDSRHQKSVRLAPDAEELLSLCDMSVENMLEILIRVGGLSTISEMFNMIKNRLEFKVKKLLQKNSCSLKIFLS